MQILHSFRTAGRALDIKRKITFIHRFSLAATRLKHNKKPSQAATRNGSRDTYKQGLISNQNALRLYHKPSILERGLFFIPFFKKGCDSMKLPNGFGTVYKQPGKERNMVEYLNIKNAGNPNALNREPFSKAEVNRIWKVKDTNIYYTIILMLIYSGCRISELLDLKKEDIDLEAKCFKIIEAKTAAGIRTVPIAEKVYPFFEYWYNLNDCEYLLSTPEGEHFKYRNYYDSYWSPLMETLGMSHRPHDTRHTYRGN